MVLAGTAGLTAAWRRRRLSAVRWSVAGNILLAWVLTFPAAAGVAALVYLLVRPVFS